MNAISYNELQLFVRTGDVFTVAGNWWVSRLIRLFTWQDVSHAGMFVWLSVNGGPKKLWLVEAMEGSGVRLVPAHKTFKMYCQGRVYLHVLKREYDGERAAQYVLDRVSEGYANPYQFIVGLLPTIRRIRRLLGKTMDTSERKWHCSEILTRAFLEQGYPHAKDAAITTPGDVAKFGCFHPRQLVYC